MARIYEAEVSRTYDAPRELLWAIVGDSNRINRVLKVPAIYTGFARDDAGQLARTAKARELGVDMEWMEPPYEWVDRRRLDCHRIYTKGPVLESGVRTRLEDEPDGRTRVTVGAWFRMAGVLRFVMGPIKRRFFRRVLGRFLDALELHVAEARKLHGDDVSAARALLGESIEPLLTGERTEVDRSLLDRRAAVLRSSARVDPEVADRLIEHLRSSADECVSQMRPFELAERWGLDRREVLRAFLHATTTGLTDLRWQINCPVCRVGASVVAELSSIGETSHCAACQINYDTDFAKHVEAVFPCNEAVRRVSPAVFCISGPAFLPHVIAQLRVVPGERLERAIDLPRGSFHVRVLGRSGGADVVIDGDSDRLTVHIGEKIEATVSTAERSTLEATVEGDDPVVLLIERAGWSADAVLGSVIASFPEFLDLFSTEAPARGVELRVGHLALLFSDLVGSTALYQQIGDARAFAIVEEHFRLSGEVIAQHDGAIVKTMGDAVMATFPSLPQAVAAARGMVALQESSKLEHHLGVKLGVHAGPCLAVRANDRLDYFGTTVNLAARLQAQAKPGELVLTRESAEEVAALVEGLPSRGFEAALKGIEARQQLRAFECVAVETPKSSSARGSSTDAAHRSA